MGATSLEDGREGHDLFIVVGARERRQSDEETAGDGGVFNVFNVVSFTKRNGGDNTGYGRGWGSDPSIPGAEGAEARGAQPTGSQWRRRRLCLI
jgi:hypothetical protein